MRARLVDCLRCYFLLFELAIQESNKACPIQISIGLPTICSFRCAQILETRYPSKQPVFSVVFPCPLFVVVFSRRKLPCGHVALVALCKRLAIRNTWMNRDELKRRILPSLINMACECLRSAVNFLFLGTVKISKQKLVGMFPSTISLTKSSPK